MLIRGWKIAALAAVGIGLGVFLNLPEAPRLKTAIPAREPLRQANIRTRKVFPFSVIPGGAASGAELRQALFSDRVAATHYTGFHLDRTRVESLRESRKVFVSYRIADRVYWTRNRLILPRGETILTDGVSSARTRCGNRISDTPQLPVNSALEPAPSILDTESSEELQTAWNSPEETSKKAVDKSIKNQVAVVKLEGAADSPSSLLAKFGPASLAAVSGGGAPMGGATGTGGVRAPGTAGVGAKGGVPPGQTVVMAETGVIPVPLPSGPGLLLTVTLPLSASSTTGSTHAVFTQQPTAGGFSFPVLPTYAYFRTQPVKSWVAFPLSPDTDLSFPESPSGHSLPLPASPMPKLMLSATLPRHEPNYEVQTPEPGTVDLMLFGFALLWLVRYAELWRRSNWKQSRKLL